MRTALSLLGVVALVCATAGSARAADVDGKWRLVLDTPGGERVVEAEFKTDGAALTGKWGGIDIKGTYTDGKIAFSFPFTPEETGEQGTLTIKMEYKDGGLDGTWEFAEYSGSCKGTRQKSE